MILIPCRAKCDQCGTEAPATIEMEGCGVVGGGLLGMGSMLGQIRTAAGWKLVGGGFITAGTAVVCSDACVTAWNEKKLKEAQDREAAEKAKQMKTKET